MPAPATTTLTTSTHRVRRTLATVITKLSRSEHHTDRTGPADLDLLLTLPPGPVSYLPPDPRRMKQALAVRPTEFPGTARPRRRTAAKRAGRRTAAIRR